MNTSQNIPEEVAHPQKRVKLENTFEEERYVFMKLEFNVMVSNTFEQHRVIIRPEYLEINVTPFGRPDETRTQWLTMSTVQKLLYCRAEEWCSNMNLVVVYFANGNSILVQFQVHKNVQPGTDVLEGSCHWNVYHAVPIDDDISDIVAEITRGQPERHTWKPKQRMCVAYNDTMLKADGSLAMNFNQGVEMKFMLGDGWERCSE